MVMRQPNLVVACNAFSRRWAVVGLVVVGGITSLLGSCAPLRPAPETAGCGTASSPDSLASSPPPAPDLLPGIGEKAAPASAEQPGRYGAPRPPRKCKGCTFYYGPTTVATAAKKATVAAAPQATATSTGRRSGPAVIASSASPLATQRGEQQVARVPPLASAPASWGGAPRSVGRAVLLSGTLALLAAGLAWLLLVLGRRRRAR